MGQMFTQFACRTVFLKLNVCKESSVPFYQTDFEKSCCDLLIKPITRAKRDLTTNSSSPFEMQPSFIGNKYNNFLLVTKQYFYW